MPVAEGDQPAPQTVVTQGGETPAVAETRRVVKVAPGHVVRKVVHAPQYVEYQPRLVYVPVYVQRHHHVYVPQHHGFYGHRAHHGHHFHRGHGHRRW
jgi:hypothetical protein